MLSRPGKANVSQGGHYGQSGAYFAGLDRKRKSSADMDRRDGNEAHCSRRFGHFQGARVWVCRASGGGLAGGYDGKLVNLQGKASSQPDPGSTRDGAFAIRVGERF